MLESVRFKTNHKGRTFYLSLQNIEQLKVNIAT